jgi:ribosome biogenesis GTPase
LNKGIIIKTTGSWHSVAFGNEIITCKIRGKFRESEIKNTNPIAVGDEVQFFRENNEHGIITSIEPRKNYIIRRSSNLSKQTHILAANINRAFLMITLTMPETSLEFVDRFLLTAEAYQIPAVIVVNKIELLNEESLAFLKSLEKIYSHAGYDFIEISVKERKGIDALEDRLKNNINLLAGNSGVGKSSLINLLCPDVNLKVITISDSHKTGKHATTYAEMIKLPFGGYIIDTPGIRGFGIIDINKNEIGLYFKDIFSISQDCDFYNCTHIHEPGCAVRQAIESGILSKSRYQSYLNIYTDNNNKYRAG